MTFPLKFLSLMLMAIIHFGPIFAHKSNHNVQGFIHRHLAARGQIVSTSTTTPTGPTISPCVGTGCIALHPPQVNRLSCTEANGTTITAGIYDREWTMLCDIDFFAQDLYPFILAGSFEECLKYCDTYNQQDSATQCAGFVFAPDRSHLDNDCYLKSSVNSVVTPSTIHLIGATLVPQSSILTSSAATPTTSVVSNTEPDNKSLPSTPVVKDGKLLGSSVNVPTKQYVSHSPALPIKLASTLLKPGINTDLVINYPLAADTGSWTQQNVPFHFELADLTSAPSLSRDGGKGGNINDTHIFYFCDTSTFGDVEGPLGYMNGFVSSSAAVDNSRKALYGEPLELEAPIGQWQDDVGRLRGWIPMTTGEEAFNIAVSGQGYRYAIWPESSFIAYNRTHSILYASVVYVEVDMQTQAAQFTSLGNTLTIISLDPLYGPYADRLVNQLFTENEVQWGTLGGLRAWGELGPNQNDGMIYLFGQVDGGILAAKVPPSGITDRSAYTYWNGSDWSSVMPGKDSTAYMVQQPVMDFDIVYSPTYKTFFMFYLTPFADNTFYIRWIVRKDIAPPYMTGGSKDYAEQIVRSKWSDPIPIWKAKPAQGFIYAGACHFGYFGANDFANGGVNLLITWTEHTEKDPNDPASGYAHKSVILGLH